MLTQAEGIILKAFFAVEAAKAKAFIFILLRFVKGEIERGPMMQGVLRRTS